MDTKQLRTFMAVVDSGSFSAAGEHLHCVQSNVTARIKSLEEHLGGVLFTRSKRGTCLTPFGTQLLGHAKDILARIEIAKSDLLDVSGGASHLRLGSLETTAGSRLPNVLCALTERLPKTQLTLSTGATGKLVRDIWERRIDAAFVTGPVDPNRFKTCLAYTETLVVASRKRRPGTNTLISFKEGCSYRATAQTWLRDEGRSDTQIMEMASIESILGCVEAGMGFSVTPRHSVLSYRAAENIEITDLPAEHRTSQTLLIWRIDHHQNKSLSVLIDIVKALN